MASYFATVSWDRGADAFADQKYSRKHTWAFDEGLTVSASASPHAIKAPWSEPRAVDPEEALAAATASCHMLFFLSGTSRAGLIVERYEDAAEAVMAKNAEGKVAVTEVILRPTVTFRSGAAPDAVTFDRLHHDAHEQCYIANSLRANVRCEATMR